MKFCQNLSLMKLLPYLTLLTLFLGMQACNNKPVVPSYLVEYESSFQAYPRQANLEWFKNAEP